MGDRSGIRAGRAFVTVGVDDRLTQGLRNAQRRLRSFGASVRRVGAGLAAVGGAALAPLLAASRQFASLGDDLAKTAERTGIAENRLAALGFAAEQSGTSLDALAGAVLRANRRIGRIVAGEGEASQVDALERLGLSAERLERLDPEGRLLAIADAFGQFEDQTVAAGLAQRAFGTAVDQILPFLRLGSDGIERLTGQFGDLFGEIGGGDIDAAVEITDAFNELRTAIRGITFNVGAALAPVLTDIIDRISGVVVRVREWVEQNRELVVTVAGIAAGAIAAGGAIAAAGVAIGVLAAAITPVIASIGALASVVGLLASPAGLAAAVVAVGGLVGSFQDLRDIAARTFDALSDIANDAVGGIIDALGGNDLQAAQEIFLQGFRALFARVKAEALEAGRAVQAALFGELAATLLDDAVNRAESQARAAESRLNTLVNEEREAAEARRERERASEAVSRLPNLARASGLFSNFAGRDDAPEGFDFEAAAERFRNAAPQLPTTDDIDRRLGSAISGFAARLTQRNLTGPQSNERRTADATEETAEQTRRLLEFVRTSPPNAPVFG